MQYIKRIDGLRGISVLAVLMFHLNFALFEGGFIGVDIFFVISGFLITGVIQDQLNKSKFNVFSFYLRRIKRLLPPLYVMLFIVAGLSLLWFLPHEIKDIYQAIVATTIYLSNIFNYRETDYFNTFHAKSPLLHTWSLSVEEQFYFVYPFILILLRKVATKKRILILLALTIISFGASFYYYHIDPLYTFYYPWFRGWELGLGGITFLLVTDPAISPKLRFQNLTWLYYLSLIIILLSIVFCRDYSYIPNFGALPAVLATCFILAGSRTSDYRFDPLKSSLLVGTGLISYSLYLWHQPILAIVYTFDESLLPTSKLLIVVLSFIAAYLSWKLVEQPFRKLKTKPARIWVATFIFSASLVLLGAYGHISNGFMNFLMNRIPPARKAWVVKKDEVMAKRQAVWVSLLDKNEARPISSLKNVDYLIIGDSKSEDMLTAFTLNKDISTNYTFYQLRADDEDMGALNDALLKRSSAGLSEVNKKAYQVLSQVKVLGIKNIILTCTWQDDSNVGVSKLIQSLSQEANSLYVVSTANWNDVTSLSFKLAKSNMTDNEIGAFFYHNIREDWKRQSDHLHEMITKISNVTWLNKEDAFCNSARKECLLYTKDKIAYIFDSGHFTIEGAQYFGNVAWKNHWFGFRPRSAEAGR
ncbi:MAG: acyltransferase family protein [Pedobacter sp.]|nr:acyltransferase family protein [Pedobacter sp.]MDQ8052903.1 acyltransferase family protein [Pedobacter sp.]